MRPKKQKYKNIKQLNKRLQKMESLQKAAWKSTSPGKPETGNQKLFPYKMMPENAI